MAGERYSEKSTHLLMKHMTGLWSMSPTGLVLSNPELNYLSIWSFQQPQAGISSAAHDVMLQAWALNSPGRDGVGK